MICFLRRARRCFAVKGAGAGVLTALCMAGAVLGVKGSGSVGCLTLANEIPFTTTLGCSEKRFWIQLIAACLDEIDFVCQSDGLAPLANPNLLNCPCGVLCDQRLRIGCRALQRGNVRPIANITQGDADVAQEAATLNSFNRRLFEKLTELRVSEFQVFASGHAVRRLTCRERCLVRNLSEAIPRTNIQAIVATEDSISDQRPKLQRNGTLQLDRQIRNAPPCIESIRSSDCSRRTRFNAALTRSTAISDWLIGRQFERRQNFREEEPGPQSFID